MKRHCGKPMRELGTGLVSTGLVCETCGKRLLFDAQHNQKRYKGAHLKKPPTTKRPPEGRR